MRIGWLLSCRSNSKRCPNKSTDLFYEEFSIPQYIFLRLNNLIKKSTNKDLKHKIIFVLPLEDKYTKLSLSLDNYPIFFGSQNDLFKRNLDCALENGFDYIIRVTCDDPFKDFESALIMLDYALTNNLDLINNENQISNWIEGTTLEIYKTKFLRWLYFNAWSSFQREHMEFRSIINVYSNLDFKIKDIKSLKDLGIDKDFKDLKEYSITIDTPEEFIRGFEIAKKLEIDHKYSEIVLLINDKHKKKNKPNTKNSHFTRLVRAETTRISRNENYYLNQIIESDLRGSKLIDMNSKLEENFAQIFNVKHAISMCNGTHTLECSLRAIGVKPGDEIIVPNLTMAATCMSVISVGCLPIFTDVNKTTLQICEKQIEKNITSKTKAVIAVSLFGGLPNLKNIKKICIERNIHLIEDNAESMLSIYKGKIYGLYGDISSFSFQATKHLTALEGGICLTNNDKLALLLRQYSAVGYSTISIEKTSVDKNLIQNPDFERHLLPATNSRMSPLSAALICGQLERIHHLVNIRIYCAELYEEVIKKFDQICFFQESIEDSKSSYWGYPIVFYDKKNWSKFRKIFIAKGGLPFYAAWKLNSEEPAMSPIHSKNELLKRLGPENYNLYKEHHSKINKTNALFVQERMAILRTNLWDYNIVNIQAKILKQSLFELNG